ncbi:uncharacterized protein PV07_00655 [Cladophialophora immunda]|uniref:Uncharacterized protein n=1 Tax=Cladophialophora immunda TaxID=569365 RepID=A0A0D2A069_9EURO|nr:uncharacterized protein PV07_00655 [Cladophialophora immunda]KIW33836.1 hypothetical protein PV07_00655 [Cladophialophora immunda]OQU94351.1 hypothetical protein CLAIMM_00712 [Cladophialophora immunda]
MSLESLNGKVIAITGGSSGIGLGVVTKLLKIGAKVAIADLNRPTAEVLDSFGKADVDYKFTTLDVSEREAVHQWVESVVRTFGRLDGMVPNAAICPDEENYWGDKLIQQMIGVNIMGVWHCATEAYMQFQKQNGPGVIVATTSCQGMRGGPNVPGYTATKHAVIGLVRALAVDWAPQGVRINAVAPGVIDTPLQKARSTDPEQLAYFMSKVPLRRVGKADEVADSFLFLLSDTSTYVTGTVLSCDGGLTI